MDSQFLSIKNEINLGIDTNESRLFIKLRELQQNLENHLASSTKILENRIETLAGMVDSSLNNFEKNLLSNREVFVDIVNKLNGDISEQHLSVCRDLQNLANEIHNFQDELDSINEAFNDKTQDLLKKIALVESETVILSSSEKLIRENMINRVSEDFDERIKEFEEKIEGFDERLNEEEKIQQGNDDRNLENFKEINEKLKKIKELAKGSKVANVLEMEEKERIEDLKEIQNIIDGLVSRVENIQTSEENKKVYFELIEAKQEIEKIKNILEEELNYVKSLQGKSLEEAKIMIQRIFDQKVGGIHEKIKRDNEELWKASVQNVKNPNAPKKDESYSLGEKITSIANTEKELIKPKLRL